jgi:hypothetical protein
MPTVQEKHAIWLEGGLFATPDGYRREVFNPDYPYTYCRICGDLYQSHTQRAPTKAENPAAKHAPYDPINAPNDTVGKAMQRRNWAIRHERSHTPAEVARYSPKDPKTGEVTARLFSPEAAHRLVPFGIIPLSGMVLDPEVEYAANTAPRLSQEEPLSD